MSSPSLPNRLGRIRHRLASLFSRGPRRLAETPIRTAENEPSSEDGDHLREVPHGAGCTEIWEHLSERRESEEADEGD